MRDTAATVMERCDLLANISGEPGLIVRPYGSRAMNEANSIVAGWMRMAGMTTGRDEIGNLVGRYEGTGEKTLLLGSHLDTVRDAGRYDGILGVLSAVACVQQLHNRGERLPFAIEVVAFADEEGLRFGTTFLGSSAYAGAFDRKRLDLEDGGGVTLMEAVRAFGGDPFALEVSGRDPADLLGYCEVHIEQGPVLEDLGLPVGVVTAINGQSRVRIAFRGKAGHAGTVPMEGRKDALCAAAGFVLEASSCAREEPPAVATVGEIRALPGAINVVPGEARLSLDLRHPVDGVRELLRDNLERRAAEIAAENGCSCEWQLRQETPAVPADRGLSDLLAGAVEDTGLPVHRLPSGAGHDAAQVSVLAPIAMLFVRCEEGISHNPAESVAKEDVEVAIRTLGRFIRLVAEVRT
ncbi:MAG: N-carbamoyl-L-amino acid hydrolase [uncultured Rubrobacteraceae bacterium]|uniref:N-carbamoyl-L-amino acid hydrolase n=1 Tax=uncultured Rubrobacteraceae bacterium TaxID=349277 RepID=A0A6J4RHW9_9ACTN|nr:MAG: N-carbamoyl-L-amino acid hydrolase [uncultured Rubrobacteraceae bacterium]